MSAKDAESPLFRFAVISDTHIRPPESDDSSPWVVNSYANGRARQAVSMVRAFAPEFVIHLGDMVHPLPSLPSYDAAVDEAKRIFDPLRCPLYLIPGNHDIGDKPMPGLPAAPVDDAAVATFRENFGEDWRAFEHGGCRFILLNAEIINSGLPAEEEQKRWLEQTLGESFEGRTIVCIHYPPCILSPDEPSNYDNLDEPGRSWLLRLLENAGVEVLFAGHVHNFFYNRFGKLESYILPALSFVRQDYSEMFRGEPGKEFGRNDADKLGFFMVDVYEDRITPRLIRTHGAMLDEAGYADAAPAAIAPLSIAKTPTAPLGLHLRHNWAEIVSLPYNGPMDEFLRKEARNDYYLLALLELGTARLRIPLRDFASEPFRDRVRDLAGLGFKFTAFHFGVPGQGEIAALEADADLIASAEFVIPWSHRKAFASGLAGLRKRLPMPASLTRVESSAEREISGSAFSHYVSYGFGHSAWADVEQFIGDHDPAGAIDAYVFTLGWESDLQKSVADLAAKGDRAGVKIIVNVRLASENPAELIDNPLRTANRVAEATAVAHAFPEAEMFLDSFIDMERGYFPRLGLYDRRLNPNMAGKVYRNLSTILAGRNVTFDESRDRNANEMAMMIDGNPAVLLLPDGGEAGDFRDRTAEAYAGVGGNQVIDLVTGLSSAVDLSDRAPRPLVIVAPAS